jgi:hypothetical protein
VCWVIWVTLPGAGVAAWQARTAGQLATAVTNQLLEVFWASEDGGVAVVLADHLCVCVGEGPYGNTPFSDGKVWRALLNQLWSGATRCNSTPALYCTAIAWDVMQCMHTLGWVCPQDDAAPILLLGSPTPS